MCGISFGCDFFYFFVIDMLSTLLITSILLGALGGNVCCPHFIDEVIGLGGTKNTVQDGRTRIDSQMDPNPITFPWGQPSTDG